MASNTDFRMANGLAKGLLVAAIGFVLSFRFIDPSTQNGEIIRLL
jgi:hypothetical protein